MWAFDVWMLSVCECNVVPGPGRLASAVKVQRSSSHAPLVIRGAFGRGPVMSLDATGVRWPDHPVVSQSSVKNPSDTEHAIASTTHRRGRVSVGEGTAACTCSGVESISKAAATFVGILPVSSYSRKPQSRLVVPSGSSRPARSSRSDSMSPDMLVWLPSTACYCVSVCVSEALWGLRKEFWFRRFSLCLLQRRPPDVD